MAGTWTEQNKTLPGSYFNFVTKSPLAANGAHSGVVVLLQEMSVGTPGSMYTITALDSSKWPTGATDVDKFLAGQVLKGAKSCIVYNLGTKHTAPVITAALGALKTVFFNVLCYPYDAATFGANQTEIASWLKAMRDDEGVKITAVMADLAGDYEGMINVAQGVELLNGTVLTNAQTTAWVAGVTAGAGMTDDNTGKQYAGAIDVNPRMTKSQMETAIGAGKFIFEVDTSQNVTAVYDINSLLTYTGEKGKAFRKNRVVRVIDGISKDLDNIFKGNIRGKIGNNADGRSRARTMYIDYFKGLQNMGAIQNFSPDDLTVTAGTEGDSIVVTMYVQPVDAIAKIYNTIYLS